MRTPEDRAAQLCLSMAQLEEACCNLVEAQSDDIDPRKTWAEHYKETDRGLYEFLLREEDPELFDPIWKSKLNEFLNYCEMKRELQLMQPWESYLI